MNKIEQTMGYKDELEEFELATLHFSGHAIFCDEILSEETVELIKKALVLLKEIEKGEAHVMRWVEADNGLKHEWEDKNLVSENGFIKYKKEFDTKSGNNYIALFNGSSVIPTPKEGK